MDSDRDSIYLALGPLAAIVLGIVLMPLREVTIASNLTFLFLALTIVVAEVGGRGPAVATALVSALSLDFFLTQPYMQLSIAQKHDVVAFVGLAACGLLAAAFGSGRRDRRSDLRLARAHNALLGSLLTELNAVGPQKARADRMLATCLSTLPLSAIALRDTTDHVVGSTGSGSAVPTTVVAPESLLPVGGSEILGRRYATSLPPDGARMKLTAAGHHVGWLDVWGTRAPIGGEERATLVDLAAIAAALMERHSP